VRLLFFLIKVTVLTGRKDDGMDNTQKNRGGTIEQAESRKNYGGHFTAKGTVHSCYTKKQMKSLHPTGTFERAGEYAPDSKQKRSGSFHLGSALLPMYRYHTHSRALYREQGFVAVGEDRYVALLKNAVALRAVALVLCIALIAAAVIFVPSLIKSGVKTIADEDLSLAQESIKPDLDQGAVDWEGVKPQDTGGVAAGIAIPGYKSITIAANQTDVKVNFNNPEGNPCYFVISLILDDGTVLYQSKMIEPGKGLYDITLTKALSPGQYGATVKYETYSLSDQTPMNGAEVQIALIAE
jgi:hypothetical protein